MNPSSNASTLPSGFTLWTVVLGPPLLWFAQFQTRYALIPWSCANGNRFWLWSLSIAAMALAGALGAVAWICCRRSQLSESDAPPSTERRRAHFMSLLGAMSAALFLLLIMAQALPLFFVDPCIQ